MLLAFLGEQNEQFLSMLSQSTTKKKTKERISIDSIAPFNQAIPFGNRKIYLRGSFQ